MTLPRGSSVYPHAQTTRMRAGAGSPFVWHGDLIIQQQPGEDADALADRVVQKLDQRSRTRR